MTSATGEKFETASPS